MRPGTRVGETTTFMLTSPLVPHSNVVNVFVELFSLRKGDRTARTFGLTAAAEHHTLVENFKKMMNHWGHFKFIRYKIEIFFNIAKNSMNLKRNHQYSKASIEKKASRSMFLTEYLISMFNPIYTDLRAIPSW
jgi:hypothetical protein